MPDDTNPPAPAPSANATAGIWAFGWKVFGASAEQQRGFVALVLTGFLLWMAYDAVTAGRRAEGERTIMMLRAFESEGEKNRRAADDASKLIIASHQKLAVELGKLEARVADSTRQNQQLEARIAELSGVVTELRKKLPPSEVNAAPAPRMKPPETMGAG